MTGGNRWAELCACDVPAKKSPAQIDLVRGIENLVVLFGSSYFTCLTALLLDSKTEGISWMLHNSNLFFAETEICFFATTITCMTQSHLLKGLTDFIDLAQQWVMHLAGKLSRCGSKCFSLISQTLRTICRPYRDFVRSQVILSIYLSPF